MGEGLAKRVGLTWAIVGILALGIVVYMYSWRVVSEQSEYSRVYYAHVRSPLTLSDYACALCLFI